ncbi:MAG: hypothetical protein CM1200mP29_02140 [Verrucomicrobiota bacterium]|nr:MAG: hypothetical protein CM1200mP29_02140 [Verrucomicrobiota bacterium]
MPALRRSQSPFGDATFDSVGALNVLEHVEEPEAFIADFGRVVKTRWQGRHLESEFFPGLGLRDYHPRCAASGINGETGKGLQAKRRQIMADPSSVHFDRMEPISRKPFQPDDDANRRNQQLRDKIFSWSKTTATCYASSALTAMSPNRSTLHSTSARGATSCSTPSSLPAENLKIKKHTNASETFLTEISNGSPIIIGKKQLAGDEHQSPRDDKG